MTGAEEPVIVVTGEALIDIVVDRHGGLMAHPGGGPYNVARTIGRLGQPVTYLGRLSTDAFGARPASSSRPSSQRTRRRASRTLGLVLEPMATTLEELVDRIDDAALVALDPNCRPSTIDDPGAYRRRMERLLRRTDVIKVSDDDLAWLNPGTPPVKAARRMVTNDGAVALVTCGGAGAPVVTRAGTLSASRRLASMLSTPSAREISS